MGLDVGDEWSFHAENQESYNLRGIVGWEYTISISGTESYIRQIQCFCDFRHSFNSE